LQNFSENISKNVSKNFKQSKIAFIGAGNMAKAIMNGLIAAGFKPSNLLACAPSEATRSTVRSSLQTEVSANNTDAVSFADVIVIAVKPNLVAKVAAELDLALYQQANDKLIVSVAAGVGVYKLERCFKAKASLIAAMPNLPCAVKQGVIGLVAAETCSRENHQLAEAIFSSIAQTVWLDDDSQLPGLVAAAGSSPAYFFLFLEAMIASAKKLGLSEQQAKDSVLHSGFGALTMALNSNLDVATLRKQVTSPNGTTHQAIESFMQNDIDLLVNQAMQAAADKAAHY
jgi:pyrroline-5-carboxylate reductase